MMKHCIRFLFTQITLVSAALVILGTPFAHAQCTNPAGAEGQIFHNTTHKVVQFCNGTDWVNTGALATPGLPTTCDPGDTITWDGTAWTCSSGGGAPAPDTTPDAFSFADVANAALNTLISSNTVTITGIDAATPVSVSGQGKTE